MTIENIYNEGLALFHKGKYNEALECFSKIISINQNIYHAYGSRASCKFQLKDYEGVIEDTEKAACTAFNMGDYAAAIEYYSKQLTIQPENQMALRDRGVCKSKAGDYYGAIDDYTNSLKIWRKKLYDIDKSDNYPVNKNNVKKFSDKFNVITLCSRGSDRKK